MVQSAGARRSQAAASRPRRNAANAARPAAYSAMTTPSRGAREGLAAWIELRSTISCKRRLDLTSVGKPSVRCKGFLKFAFEVYFNSYKRNLNLLNLASFLGGNKCS